MALGDTILGYDELFVLDASGAFYVVQEGKSYHITAGMMAQYFGAGGGTGTGATNLSFDLASSTVISDTGTNAILPIAAANYSGLLSAALFTKLVGIENGATADSLFTPIAGGLVPPSSGNTLEFLRGDGQFAIPPSSSNTTLPPTDLSYDAATRILASSTGVDATLPIASQMAAGLMSGGDKARFDGVHPVMASAADFNSFVLPDRSYHRDTTSGAVVNAPTTEFGTLFVEQARAPDRIVQAYITSSATSPTEVYRRNLIGSGWTSWRRYLHGGDLSGLNAAIAGKAALDHAHEVATSGAAGFMASADRTKLDGIATGATANATDASLRTRTTHTGLMPVNALNPAGAVSGQALLFNGIEYAPGNVSGGTGTGATNLLWDPATSTVASDTGSDATISIADASFSGLLSSPMFTRLNSLSGTVFATEIEGLTESRRLQMINNLLPAGAVAFIRPAPVAGDVDPPPPLDGTKQLLVTEGIAFDGNPRLFPIRNEALVTTTPVANSFYFIDETGAVVYITAQQLIAKQRAVEGELVVTGSATMAPTMQAHHTRIRFELGASNIFTGPIAGMPVADSITALFRQDATGGRLISSSTTSVVAWGTGAFDLNTGPNEYTIKTLTQIGSVTRISNPGLPA